MDTHFKTTDFNRNFGGQYGASRRNVSRGRGPAGRGWGSPLSASTTGVTHTTDAEEQLDHLKAGATPY